MSTKYDEIIELMKECDRTTDEILMQQIERKTAQNTNKLSVNTEMILRSSVEKLITGIDWRNQQIRRIVDNEHLLKLYFYRFLVFDIESVNQLSDNQLFVRLKRESISVIDQLFDIFKRLFYDNIGDNELIGVQSLNEKIALISQTFTKEWMNCLAEIDVKFYELSQKTNK